MPPKTPNSFLPFPVLIIRATTLIKPCRPPVLHQHLINSNLEENNYTERFLFKLIDLFYLGIRASSCVPAEPSWLSHPAPRLPARGQVYPDSLSSSLFLVSFPFHSPLMERLRIPLLSSKATSHLPVPWAHPLLLGGGFLPAVIISGSPVRPC